MLLHILEINSRDTILTIKLFYKPTQNKKECMSSFQPSNVTALLSKTQKSSKNRIAIMVSKHSHCLKTLLENFKAKTLGGELVLVISNHSDCELLVREFGIPFHHISFNLGNKDEIETMQLELLNSQQIDLVVLARYMQILSPNFVNAYSNRIINIHHSLLPAFPGANPYQQAFDRGVKMIGATSHYVTADLDQGPIIEQEAIHIAPNDTANDYMEKGRNIESVVLMRAVRWHLENRITMNGNKCLVLADRLKQPLVADRSIA